MRIRSSRHVVALCAVLTALSAAEVHAAIIVEGLYQLHNHPDGNQASPFYGLRLDELFQVTPGHDVFTFDFDHRDAAVFLEYSGETIHIFGTAFGGLDDGSSYDPMYSSLVEFDFVYSNVAAAIGDDDLWVTGGADGDNTGTLTWLRTGEIIPLWDKNSADNFAFRFGDGSDDNGHRDFSGLSGWGWLTHTTFGQHVSSSDWIFTAEHLPAPPALVVLGFGLFLGRQRRRR